MSEQKPAAKKIKATPQQLLAANPDLSIWVSANAGSGKTHVLVERVIRLLLAGAEPASILCITYTKAAAAEMSARLFARLGGWAALSDQELTGELNAMEADGGDAALRARARSLFTLALETPGGLKIQTIHAFCERLLHLFPVEAGIAPGFSVMDERDTDDMQARATEATLQHAESGAAPELAASFQRLAENLNEEQFASLIRSFVSALRKSGAKLSRLTRDAYQAGLKAVLGVDPALTADEALQRVVVIEHEVYLHHAELLRPHFSATTNASEQLLKIVHLVDERHGLILDFYLTKTYSPRKSLILKDAQRQLPDTDAYLKQEQARVLEAVQLANTLKTIEASADAFTLASAILQRIEQEKRSTGQYDFDDLISRAARLLSSGPSTQWVLKKLDAGINHILLDEAQDTGPHQWEMILALAQEFFAGSGARDIHRTLFVVGDKKQSIYSFQGADVSAYAHAHELFLERGWLKDVELSISYRSTDQVLEAVDRVFAVDGKREHTVSDSRKEDTGLVEIWPLVPDDEDEPDDPWTTPLDRAPKDSAQRKLARLIAGKIASWLDPKAPRKLAGADRAVTAGDILILFRNRNAFFRMVLAELRARHVPVAGADRLNLLKSLIVQDLQMLISWVLLPEDDYALAVILKSPLVPEPLNEEQLFHLVHGRESALHERLTGRNRAWLDQLREMQASPFVFLSHVLNTQRKAILKRLGSEALEASGAMLDLALDYERQSGPSLFGFLRWFSSTETTIKRELEKGTGEVRLMTVHGAKGLEAPVVILADAKASGGGPRNMPQLVTAPENSRVPGLPVWLPSGSGPLLPLLDAWVQASKDKATEENRRLLYVAMTRAADELYIFGRAPNRNSSEESWWDWLAPLGLPEGEEPVRFGPADEFKTGESKDGGSDSSLPLWIDGLVATETPVAPIAVTKAVSGTKDYDPGAARRGRAIHRLLEELADVPADQRSALAARRALRLGVSEADANSLVKALTSPDLAIYTDPISRGEVDISGELMDGRHVSGRIDRLSIRPEGIWLLDWKTDRYVPDSLPQDHDYAKQLAGYVELLQAAHPGLPVTAAIFWTEKARLDILPALHTTDSADT